MPPVRRAVIDVGTNSVKLLVADVDGGRVLPILEAGEQTRLGEGFYTTRTLTASAIERTGRAVAFFHQRAARAGATTCRVIATSAARDATNARELVEAVRREIGLPLEIISGECEAEWSFLGVTTDPALREASLLITDVGGGSTEFVLGTGAHVEFRCSVPLGTVRMLESFPHDDPPTAGQRHAFQERLRQFFRNEVLPRLTARGRETELSQRLLVGTGGTPTLLARIHLATESYDRSRIERVRLDRGLVTSIADRLWNLPLAARRQVAGLPANRADVILMGVEIYSVMLAEFGVKELRVSTRGLRFAAVREH